MVAPINVVSRLALTARLPTWDPRLFWATVALAAALLVGAMIIAIVDRWRKRPVKEFWTARDQLAHFRTLYERGEMSSEEFARVRTLLTERIKKDLEVATPQPQTPEVPHEAVSLDGAPRNGLASPPETPGPPQPPQPGSPPA